jgi:sarcosine oxidase
VIPQPSSGDASSFDVIVIGVGTMGAPTCYELARRGTRVLGIEQFDITHEFGSHAGQSRIIRKAYFEHPDYVPLLQRAYENWRELEARSGEQVYYQTGVVYFGRPDHEIISGVKCSAGLHRIEIENIDPAASKERFPSFSVSPQFETVFEPAAGFLTPEKAIKLFAGQAVKNGARIHTHEKVIEWKKSGNRIVVWTDKHSYNCGKLVITAGAWSDNLVPGIAGKMEVTRQFVAWVRPKNRDDFALGRFPCWLINDDERPGCYYGFPVLPEETFGAPHGLKIAWHYPGSVTEVDKVNKQNTEEDIGNIRYVLDKYLPGIYNGMVTTKTCLYANLPDENFIIDKLPGFENYVAIGCGFSGHGFKFASVVGEVLADLSLDGHTRHPIGFLNARRFK